MRVLCDVFHHFIKIKIYKTENYSKNYFSLCHNSIFSDMVEARQVQDKNKNIEYPKVKGDACKVCNTSWIVLYYTKKVKMQTQLLMKFNFLVFCWRQMQQCHPILIYTHWHTFVEAIQNIIISFTLSKNGFLYSSILHHFSVSQPYRSPFLHTGYEFIYISELILFTLLSLRT